MRKNHHVSSEPALDDLGNSELIRIAQNVEIALTVMKVGCRTKA